MRLEKMPYGKSHAIILADQHAPVIVKEFAAKDWKLLKTQARSLSQLALPQNTTQRRQQDLCR